MKSKLALDLVEKISVQSCGTDTREPEVHVLDIRTKEIDLSLWIDQEWWGIIAVSMLEELPKEMQVDLLENSELLDF